VVDPFLMCVCDFQESKETPNPSGSQNNARRNQRFLRSLTRTDCESESPDCKQHEDIEHAERVFPRPVAVVRPAEAFRGRLLSESIALAKAHAKELGYEPILDADFAADLEEIINSHCKPLNPPTWD